MKFLNSSGSTVIAGNLTFQVGVSTEIGGYTLDGTTLKALGLALQNGSILPLDADAKRFIGINNLAPALFNLPDNNSSADRLVPSLFAMDANSLPVGLVGPDGSQSSWLTAHASEHIAMGNPLRREQGGVFCDWSSEQGVLVVSSSNAGEAISLDPTVMVNGKPSVKCIGGSTPSTAPVYVGRYAY